MNHIIVERADVARKLYLQAAQEGQHAILDAPGDFRTNLPERRLSAADVLVSVREPISQPTTMTNLCSTPS